MRMKKKRVGHVSVTGVVTQCGNIFLSRSGYWRTVTVPEFSDSTLNVTSIAAFLVKEPLNA